MKFETFFCLFSKLKLFSFSFFFFAGAFFTTLINSYANVTNINTFFSQPHSKGEFLKIIILILQ